MGKHLFSNQKHKDILIYFMKYIFILSIPVFLSACEIVVDEIFDCIDFDKPEFETDSLPIAILNQGYSSSIVAEVQNHPNDDYYDYEFDLEGDLPDGLKLLKTS